MSLVTTEQHPFAGVEVEDIHGRWHNEDDGGLGLECVQEIDVKFVDFLRDLKAQSATRRTELEPVCSVPAVLADHWYRTGFNIWDPNVTARDIKDRLSREGLDHFITTVKAI